MTDKQRKECPWRIGNCCSALLSIKSARDSKCCDKNCAPKFILDLEKGI